MISSAFRSADLNEESRDSVISQSRHSGARPRRIAEEMATVHEISDVSQPRS